uniref:Major facilitator superfamily (MFS) profile domain-containing protein n=1 Tax=Bionectria ochroleuca TaxID=29856 RepID=A0A8H7N2U3_BIOOC
MFHAAQKEENGSPEGKHDLKTRAVGHRDETEGELSAMQNVPDWSKEEEERVLRKIDFLLMPLLVAGFYVLQLNRGNISNALTDGFLKDVGITQDQFNIGQQLLSVGIIIIEVPSNMILYRLGPSNWITVQILAWGLVSILQAIQQGLGAYLATRILLGICLGGYIPASLYSITMWYKKSETSARFSIFFMGNSVARASSGLVAFGLLRMRGAAGLAGWKWLMIIDGLMAILVGLVFALLFPGTPFSSLKSLCRIGFFTEREAYIARQRVVMDDPTTLQKRRSVTVGDVISTLTNWTIYPHLLIALLGNAPANAISSYGPTIINSFGYERLTSNALNSVGSWIQLFLNPAFGYLADRLRMRGLSMMIGLGMWWLFMLITYLVVDNPSKEVRYAVLTLALSFVGVWHPINGSWIALNARNAKQRSITMAVYIMIANCAGIVGGPIFSENDAPIYRRAWTISVALLSAALFCGVLAHIQYYLLNRRAMRRETDDECEGSSASGDEEGSAARRQKYEM